MLKNKIIENYLRNRYYVTKSTSILFFLLPSHLNSTQSRNLLKKLKYQILKIYYTFEYLESIIIIFYCFFFVSDTKI